MSRRIVGWGSSSMALIGPAMDSVLAADGIRFINEGRGGETSHHTAARIGSLPVPVRVAGGTLPNAGTVRMGPTGLDLSAAALKPFAGRVGDLDVVVHGSEEGVFLTRTEPGAPVPVDGGPVVPNLGTAWRGEDCLLWMGKNDLNRGSSATGVIARIDATADWLAEAGARVVVISQFTNNDSDPEMRDKILAINTAGASRYGDCYVDVQRFLTSRELPAVTGLAPTPEDLSERRAGNKPPSLSTDPGHLTTAGSLAVARHLRAHLHRLGWLDCSTA
ncbi:hypothetical protein [Brachybacterium sp. FME24]|uniref:hypothetical protein n=1 Tax=Brachybacterium sp. FME24 TaxID=2742605 RepID=UPI001866C8C4|nr:hypothetical protein [Brachybacterium sp. FME24]